ncbi:unnamed protein product [Acanthoscelides obtectus]|nr:unnamed protein product [Acanthoscelides obtectus]CAH2011141.1 unnamed protein product [Acanthoscelides obtectus]CAK1665490.1 Pyrokinin-1 receptor [Acanthoscelides obtectus]CAK1665516.1 Pyrokinin-1 receptor [Acanthoscelides obtectus]
MYVSGVLYFVSTCVNPILYHIMSKRFRKAFKGTFRKVCCAKNSNHYLVVHKVPPSERDMQRSNSEGVPQLTREFAQNRGQSEYPIRLGDAGRSSTRSTYLLSSFRAHSLKDKSCFKKNSEKNIYVMPLRLCGMFRKHDVTRASFDTSNTISNSSLKDTDSSEFNRYDLVNNMLRINEKML